jgi:hypothetical protein
MGNLRTTILVNTGALGGDEYDVPVEVQYTYRAGCSATYTKPGEADTVSLDRITIIEADGSRAGADWLIGILENDDEILAQCGQDWAERQDYAAGQAADARREDAWLARIEGKR